MIIRRRLQVGVSKKQGEGCVCGGACPSSGAIVSHRIIGESKDLGREELKPSVIK